MEEIMQYKGQSLYKDKVVGDDKKCARTSASNSGANTPQEKHTKSNRDTTNEEKWEEMYNRLMKFRQKHGHCLVPFRYAVDRKLGIWVQTQRQQHKYLSLGSCDLPKPMNHARAKRLEEIGFVWTPKKSSSITWENRLKELVEFKTKHGHTEVPMRYKDNISLSYWVSTQRQEYRNLQNGDKSRLTPERLQMLNRIGFKWEAKRGVKKGCNGTPANSHSELVLSQVDSTANVLSNKYKSIISTTIEKQPIQSLLTDYDYRVSRTSSSERVKDSTFSITESVERKTTAKGQDILSSQASDIYAKSIRAQHTNKLILKSQRALTEELIEQQQMSSIINGNNREIGRINEEMSQLLGQSVAPTHLEKLLAASPNWLSDSLLVPSSNHQFNTTHPSLLGTGTYGSVLTQSNQRNHSFAGVENILRVASPILQKQDAQQQTSTPPRRAFLPSIDLSCLMDTFSGTLPSVNQSYNTNLSAIKDSFKKIESLKKIGLVKTLGMSERTMEPIESAESKVSQPSSDLLSNKVGESESLRVKKTAGWKRKGVLLSDHSLDEEGCQSGQLRTSRTQKATTKKLKFSTFFQTNASQKEEAINGVTIQTARKSAIISPLETNRWWLENNVNTVPKISSVASAAQTKHHGRSADYRISDFLRKK